MTIASIQNPAPSVKTRPYLVTSNGRRYWLSVYRACGHDELVDAADNRGDYTAQDWAARNDIPCAACRRKADAQRPTVPTLIQYLPKQYQHKSGGGSGSGSTRRATTHRNRRSRSTSRDARIAAAWDLYSGADRFLAEVAAGQHHDAPPVIALAKKFRAQGLRQLRALGVVL
jgi:hypothetical protein